MKVLGQLESAQFENLAAAPTPASQGRVYWDTTLNAPQVYTGSVWKQLSYNSGSILALGNSGTTLTVNWANGLTQSVVLSANCVISFINPQVGQTHTLIVQQAVLDNPIGIPIVPYGYQLNMPDQYTQRGPFQPVGWLVSSQTRYHSWYYSPAVVPAYNDVPGALPLYNAVGTYNNVSFSPDSLSVLATRQGGTAAGIHAIYDVDTTPNVSASNLVAAPTQTASATYDGRFSPNGSFFAYAYNTTPFVNVAFVHPAKGFNLPVSLGGTSPGLTGNITALDWHPSSDWLVCNQSTTPYVSALRVQANSGNVVQQRNTPGVAAAGATAGVAFSPLGDFVAVAGATTPYLQVYNFNYSTGFGALVTAPSIAPTGAPPTVGTRVVAWRPQGDWIAMSIGNVSPYIYLIPFNRTAGTFGTPSTIAAGDIPPGQVNCLTFSRCGNFLFLGLNVSNYYRCYQFSSTGLTSGSSMTFDNYGIFAAITSVEWSPNNEFIAVTSATSPFLTVYPAPRVAKNYVKLS